jgi:DNA polymerase-1
LISTYGGLEGIFANVDAQTPKLRASLVEHKDRAWRNEGLMTLRHDTPVDVDISDLRPKPKNAEVRRLFDFLEFKSMHARFRDAMSALGIAVEDVGSSGSGPLMVRDVSTPTDLAEILAILTPLSRLDVAAAWSGEPGRSDLEGISIVIDSASMRTLWLNSGQIESPEIRALIEASRMRTHEGKSLLRALLDKGIDPVGLELDTVIAEYLIDPGQNHYSLADIVAKHSDTYFPDDAASAGQLDLDSSHSTLTLQEASGRDALAVSVVADRLTAALEAQGMLELYHDVENPLVRVLARMEHLGIGVDVAQLRIIAERLTNRASELSGIIQTLAGHPFNPNSPTQLAKILFEERSLTPPKKTKTGYSTDAATLEKLRESWPEFIEPLLEYREVEKLRGTYGEGLLAEVASDGRIHATFNQTVARTGRLSSDRPNLHNIPVRTEEGRVFRTAFVPRSGCEFLVADYNQIELRCIAHLSDDPGLISAFAEDRDVHNATASRVFGVDEKKVSVEQRSKAKMVSYGLAYGMEAYGLGQRLGIPTDEAATILDTYFVAFPNVHAYMERTVAEAKARGFTETLFGRRRRIPELDSPNFRIRQAGERQAMNAGIQGLAADIFKIALIDIDTSLTRSGFESRLVLQVHDEVIVEVPVGEKDAVGPLVLGCMENAAELKVPLAVNFAWGKSWAEAKS